MTETRNPIDPERDAAIDSDRQTRSTLPVTQVDENKRSSFAWLKRWETGVLLLSFFLIVFVAIPNFLHALTDFRGVECSNRLTLMANALKFLAERNNTQPGEQICELFELNELLVQIQRGSFIALQQARFTTYYKAGSDPDCPNIHGKHIFEQSLILGEDGEIVPPQCALAHGPRGEFFRKRGWHVCDMSRVTGEIELFRTEEEVIDPEDTTSEGEEDVVPDEQSAEDR